MPLATLRRAAGYLDLAASACRLRAGDDEVVQRRVRRHLAERMGKLRGLPQKLGQMLSFSDRDEHVADQYAALQETAEALPWEVIEPLLVRAWGRPVAEVMSSIDPCGQAASLGQVHRGVTRNGVEVAVKVQYPGVRDAVETDLRMLGWLSMPLGNLRRGFDMRRYRDVITQDLDRELDYAAEAEHQRRFRDWAAREPFLVVPRVHGLFMRRQVHADLHPGNLRFRMTDSGPKLVLYDFGCVYEPSRETVLALLRLIRATEQHCEPPLPLFVKLGFRPEYLAPLADKLPALCQVLLEPFVADHNFDLAHWRLDERMRDVLGDDRWNFRIAGPAEMIFLMRAFHGLLYYLRGLGAPVNWRRMLWPCMHGLSGEMASLAMPMPTQSYRDFRSLAQWLKIRVSESGHTKVELTANATGIDDLEQLLDPELMVKIRERHIELEQIVRDIRRRGYTPGPVFQMDEGSKHIAVWLE